MLRPIFQVQQLLPRPHLLWLSVLCAAGSGGLLIWSVGAVTASTAFSVSGLMMAAITASAALPAFGKFQGAEHQFRAALRLAALFGFVLASAWFVAADQWSGRSDIDLPATVLLLGATATIAIASLPSTSDRDAGGSWLAWLPGSMLAAGSALGFVLVWPEKASSDATISAEAWAASCLSGTLAILLLARVIVVWGIAPDSFLRNRAAIRAGLAWVLIGTGLIVHATALVVIPAGATLWWLPVISGGTVLAASSPRHLALDQATLAAPRRHSGSRQIRGTLWLSLILVCALSAMVIAWTGRGPNDARDAGPLTLATVTLAIAVTALGALALTSQSAINTLSLRLAVMSVLSQTDALTGLANRRHLDSRLNAEIQRAARFDHALSVAMIDIDDFKSINDELGHAAGDHVLRRIGELVAGELRAIDVVGRYGGEEFLAILPETDVDGAMVAATRLVSRVRTDPGSRFIASRPVTISVGVAVFEQHGRSAGDLLSAADRALYDAKRQGKNQAVAADSRP